MPARPGAPASGDDGSLFGPIGTGARPVSGAMGAMPSPADVVGRRSAGGMPQPSGPASYGGPRPQGAPSPAAGSPSPALATTQACPHCGSQTPAGFAFCQQCGRKLPQAGSPRPPTAQPPVAGELHDAMAPTMAASTPSPLAAPVRRDRSMGLQPTVAVPAATPVETTPSGAVSPWADKSPSGPASAASSWGVLVSINQDGTDGGRYPLTGEYMEIGRADADIAFADDRFLAPRHARIELEPAGPRIVPLERLNGIFRRISEPTQLADGTVFLVGREVLRFEVVGDEERVATPMVRHGVALFGSPPREPWGRLCQLLASGGIRDVRHVSSPVITIGREEGDLVFRDDGFMSRRHATLSWRDGRCMLEDLGSSNGTFVRLTGPLTLRSGDQLRMGDQLFRFERSR